MEISDYTILLFCLHYSAFLDNAVREDSNPKILLTCVKRIGHGSDRRGRFNESDGV